MIMIDRVFIVCLPRLSSQLLNMEAHSGVVQEDGGVQKYAVSRSHKTLISPAQPQFLVESHICSHTRKCVRCRK